MEPGEYLTNVLSFNNFASINYEYFESQIPSSGKTRKQLLKVEAAWRQEALLVHCDPSGVGIWVFQHFPNATTDSLIQGQTSSDNSGIVNIQGVDLLLRYKGTYEPASLSRLKSSITNNLSTPTSSSSTSSSLENSIRSAALTARSLPANSAQTEPLTVSPGVKSEFGEGDSLPSPKEIHEYFISAVLGSFMYSLCVDHGFIPLNSRTLITSPGLNSPGFSTTNSLLDNNTIRLATLDVSLTSLGTLVAKAHTDIAPGLQSLINASGPVHASAQLTPGATLWLAPGGNAARFYIAQDEWKLPGNLPISQLQSSVADHRHRGYNGATIRSWQSKCLEWLSAKGLNTTALEEGGWIFVQIIGANSPYVISDYQGNPLLEHLAIVPWPALLCFQTSHTGGRDLKSSTMNIVDSGDPLSFAEKWFTGKDDRENIISKRRKERQVAEASSKEQADIEARAIQANYPPSAIRRGSNAGAMYPTPPDAVHHPIGATPSFDGTVSTPGNPNPLFTHDVDTAVPTTSGVVDNEAQMWDSAVRKEAPNSNIHFNDNDIDNENLFADIGGDLFGDADITDADFSFFDGPDTVDLDQLPDSPEATFLPNNEENSKVTTGAGLGDTNQDAIDAPDTHMPDSNHVEGIDNRPDVNASSETGVPAIMKVHGIADKKDREAINQPLPPVVMAPFNKEEVFKRLFQNGSAKNNLSAGVGVFNKVEFETSLLSVNEKYGLHGSFKFSAEGKTMHLQESQGLPRTEYLDRSRKIHNDNRETHNLVHIFTDEVTPGEMEAGDGQQIGYLMDSDCSSQLSEQDDRSPAAEKPSLMLKPGVKRKWIIESGEGEDMASSFTALAVDYEQFTSTPKSIAGSQVPQLDSDPADWSLATYFTSPEAEVLSNTLTDFECIATAQILTDQAVSSTFQLPGSNIQEGIISVTKAAFTKELMHNLVRSSRGSLKDVTTCTMRSFMDIQGIPVLNQGLRLPPRPIPNPRAAHTLDGTRSNNPFLLPAPQLEVRRSESKLTILPPAVAFWETLGLGPSTGCKDVNAVCVYPDFDGVAENASTFLDEMRSIYESSRLGSHERIICQDLANSLLPYAVDPLHHTNKLHHAATLKETAAQLSRSLASLPVEEKNFVVYFVYPVDNTALLVHICSAFQYLFDLYRNGLLEKKINITNELVLQLIPLDFIASFTSLVLPLPSEYRRLAMEVYDRCMDFASSASTPAILLEKPLPKSIDFKLNANPSPSLLQENSCLHVAYAQSTDDRWITAAWTDNRGSQHMTASYCLGRKNEPMSLPFSDVANEIWETTLDTISSKKVHWRIMIVKVGVMEPAEVDLWTSLASAESAAQINLTLLTVQTDPSLRLLPASATISPVVTAAPSVITPVSTPQALQSSVISSDNPPTPARDVNAGTPGDAPVALDSDARLIDFTDQSWGSILSHRLNNSKSLVDVNLALISGYLIKRGGTNSEDPPIVMEVNIVHSEVVGNPRTFHESLLREILGYYRGLGTLARVRGVVDAVKDIRPWHIAVAEKAVKALYVLM